MDQILIVGVDVVLYIITPSIPFFVTIPFHSILLEKDIVVSNETFVPL